MTDNHTETCIETCAETCTETCAETHVEICAETHIETCTNESDECVVCYDSYEVLMTCKARHKLCFKCVVNIVETNNKIGFCPTCRGGNKYIIVDKINKNKNDFYSISYYNKCHPFIINMCRNIVDNSCLISEEELLHYIKNKQQLEVAVKLLNDFPVEKIINIIQWKISSTNNIFHELGFGGGDARVVDNTPVPITPNIMSVPIPHTRQLSSTLSLQDERDLSNIFRSFFN